MTRYFCHFIYLFLLLTVVLYHVHVSIGSGPLYRLGQQCTHFSLKDPKLPCPNCYRVQDTRHFTTNYCPQDPIPHPDSSAGMLDSFNPPESPSERSDEILWFLEEYSSMEPKSCLDGLYSQANDGTTSNTDIYDDDTEQDQILPDSEDYSQIVSY